MISNILLSIQAFTYTCCSEAAEVRRLAQKELVDLEKLRSMFGVHSIICNGKFIVLPKPSPAEDGWPFKGRLGKLRYLGLAIMTATRGITREIMQVAFDFLLQNHTSSPLAHEDECREEDGLLDHASIAHPLLCGNIISRVVAAMCVTISHTKDGSNSHGSQKFTPLSDTVFRDSEAIIGLGFLARVLQVILASMQQATRGVKGWDYHDVEKAVLIGAGRLLDKEDKLSDIERSFSLLIKTVLPSQSDILDPPSGNDGIDYIDSSTTEDFCLKAFKLAGRAAADFLLDIGVVFQLLAPAWSVSNEMLEKDDICDISNLSRTHDLPQLMSYLRVEPIAVMLESPFVCGILDGWYKNYIQNQKVMSASQSRISSGQALTPSLDFKALFLTLDWPMPPTVHQNQLYQAQISHDSNSLKGRVHLLGDFHENNDYLHKNQNAPRIKMLSTSFTDLYAEVRALSPDFKLTGLCLVCGQVRIEKVVSHKTSLFCSLVLQHFFV